ncbi:MAG: hypothetical protein GY708_05015, partial [Actinomycetia bacterium]|nr:hypothetical protein [Actinomycetes bacterium]
MRRKAVLLGVVLVVSTCSAATEEVETSPTTSRPAPITAAATTAPPLTAATVTTTTVRVIGEWVEAFPVFGTPGDALEICGVAHGADRLDLLVRDPRHGDTWPADSDATVRPLDTGQWCWEGRFPAEMETEDGERLPIESGLHDIDVFYEGEVILHTTVEIATAELVAALPPSQSPEDALRDGVVPEIALLPLHRRVRAMIEVPAEEGVWTLGLLSRAVEEESHETGGCFIGDPTGVWSVDYVCTAAYGELLLVDQGKIVKAYPMPSAPPSWVHVTDAYIYGGHVGDGAYPDSTLVRIDRETLEATVVVIPSTLGGGFRWPSTWHVAPVSFSDRYYEAVHINSGAPGTIVSS